MKIATWHLQERRGFTLLELLTVIAIIGILAAITVPNLHQFKPNVMAGASSQLLNDVAKARQLAIKDRTTVYMIFVPANFWNDPKYNVSATGTWPQAELDKAKKLFDKQLTAYAYVSLRSLGDQPGAPTVRYLSEWKTLPAGSLIPSAKFVARGPLPALTVYTNRFGDPTPLRAYDIYGFSYTNNIPFPSASTPAAPGTPSTWVTVPYIAFNHLGQLVSGRNELIPLALGSVGYSRDPVTKEAINRPPSVTETPAGNSTNSFNLVSIEWLTGRSRIERQEAR